MLYCQLLTLACTNADRVLYRSLSPPRTFSHFGSVPFRSISPLFLPPVVEFGSLTVSLLYRANGDYLLSLQTRFFIIAPSCFSHPMRPLFLGVLRNHYGDKGAYCFSCFIFYNAFIFAGLQSKLANCRFCSVKSSLFLLPLCFSDHLLD